MTTLGQNIRKLRHQKSWSQEDVAKRLDISIPAFSKIETGVTDINLSRLTQLAVVFDVTVIKLLTLGDSTQQNSDSDLEIINKKLLQRETEVIDLQKKVIELFEELRVSKSTA